MSKNREEMKNKIRFKEKGNEEFRVGYFVAAIEWYNKALEIDPEDTDILSNRAMAYINIGCCELALKDSEKVLMKNPYHEKCIYRKVKSLWGLKQYGEALRFINSEIPKELLKKQDFCDIKVNGQKMLRQMMGQYDMLEIMDYPRNRRNDFAEYTGPVKIVQVPGKGRGLVATRDFSRGELILCSKAYAIVFGKVEDWEKRSGGVDHYREEVLRSTVARKLIWEPSSREEFCKLNAGPDSKKEENWLLDHCKLSSKYFLNDKIDSHPHFEVRVHMNNMLICNAFEHLTESRGVWILPSYINHSCVDYNAVWTIYGDALMVRATKPIKAGEEIIHAYCSEPSRQEIFSQHKFTCNCRLCELERSESSETRQAMKETLQSIQNNLNKNDASSFTAQFQRVKKLISFRPQNLDINILLLEQGITDLASQLFKAQQWEYAIEMFQWIRTVTLNADLSLSSMRVLTLDNVILQCGIKLKHIRKHQNKRYDKFVDSDAVLLYGKEAEEWSASKRNEMFNQINKNLIKIKRKD